MLIVPIQSWGFFRVLPDERLVLRLLAEGERIARASVDQTSLVRLLAELAYFNLEAAEADEVTALVESLPDPRPLADTLRLIAQMRVIVGDIAGARSSYARIDELVASGAVVNEGEVLMWRTVLEFLAGNLEYAQRLADALLNFARTRSAHLRGHALGALGLVAFGRGDWDRLRAIAREAEALVTASPGLGFCLIPAAAVAQGAVAERLAGRIPPDSTDALVERMVPESASVRAATLVLPRFMAGATTPDDDVRTAYATRRMWHRNIWDPAGINLALALTVAGRWDEVPRALAPLDDVAGRGGRVAGALAAAIREEMEAAPGGPAPGHHELRALGYLGLSEVVRFRTPTPVTTA